MKTFYGLLLFTFSVLLTNISLFSQSKDSVKYSTSEIDVFSNKTQTNNFNSPSRIQTITESDIRNKNGDYLSDILQNGGGVFLKNYGGTGSLSTLSMNGLGAEHTLILLNGFRLNSVQNSQVDLNLISKDNIKEIEILNNGSSALYGSNAIGGVINIRTRNDMSNKLNFNLKGEVGSYSQKKYLVGFGNTLGKFNFSLNFSDESSLNDFQYYYDNGYDNVIKSRVNSGYNFSNKNLSLNFKLSDNTYIKYFSDYTVSLKSIPGIESGSEPSKAHQDDKNWNNILLIDKSAGRTVGFKSQFNFQNNLMNYYDNVLINSWYKNESLSNLTQISFTKNNFETVAGFEAGYSFVKSNEITGDAKRFQGSLFAVSKMPVMKSLILYPSARYDYFSDIKRNVFSGKFGLNYKPFESRDLNIKFSTGNNFSAPTFNELYWKTLGNVTLNPESSFNTDAGIIFSLNKNKSVIIELTYTYINAEDKIVWLPEAGGLWMPQNIGKSISNIFSADMNSEVVSFGKFTAGISMKYSHTSSLKKSSDLENDPSYNKQMIYVPEHLFKINLNMQYGNTGLNVFSNYTGERFTDSENKNSIPPSDVVDANIFHNIDFMRMKYQIKLEANNIFNENYQAISGFPMPLRNYKLILSINY